MSIYTQFILSIIYIYNYHVKLTYKSSIKDIYLNDVKSFIWTIIVFIHKSKYQTIEDDKRTMTIVFLIQ